LGGQRGRLIPHEQRALAVQLIEEAKAAGAQLAKACEVLEIHTRTFKRWKAGKLKDLRKGAAKSVPRRLTDEERQAIINVCCVGGHHNSPTRVMVIPPGVNSNFRQAFQLLSS
jgi:hypothetical protein